LRGGRVELALDMERGRGVRWSGSMVEFLAHGLNVKVPWQGGWKVVTGSSFAAPRFSAWLARLLEARLGMSVETAKEMMRGMAEA